MCTAAVENEIFEFDYTNTMNLSSDGNDPLPTVSVNFVFQSDLHGPEFSEYFRIISFPDSMVTRWDKGSRETYSQNFVLNKKILKSTSREETLVIFSANRNYTAKNLPRAFVTPANVS